MTELQAQIDAYTDSLEKGEFDLEGVHGIEMLIAREIAGVIGNIIERSAHNPKLQGIDSEKIAEEILKGLKFDFSGVITKQDILKTLQLKRKQL